MFPIPWFVAALVGIPQSFLIIVLGFSLFNLRIKFEHALVVACLASMGCYLVRLLNTVNGLHTLIVTLFLIVLCVVLTQISTYKVTTAILAGVTVAGGIEYSYLPLIYTLTSTTLHDLAQHPWWSVGFFIPEGLILLILYWQVRKHNFYILDGSLRDI